MKRTEHTQKWLDALRSGEYKQTYGARERDGAFCALGVAYRIMYKETPMDDLSKYFGIQYDEYCKIIDMNDFSKKTFPEIADAIETMLE